MIWSKQLSLLGIVALAAATAVADFSLELPVVTFERVDAIVFPKGVTAGHCHVLVGGAGVIASHQDPSKMCTTSPVTADKSLYWTTNLHMYQHDVVSVLSTALRRFVSQRPAMLINAP